MRIQLAQRAEADDLLGRSPLALLVGMLLDQQVSMEWAFTGPYTISERLGHELTAEEIASYDPEAFVALLAAKPAVHRYPSRWRRACSNSPLTWWSTMTARPSGSGKMWRTAKGC